MNIFKILLESNNIDDLSNLFSEFDDNSTILCEKARQIGMTNSLCLYSFMKCFFNNNKNIIIYCNSMTAARSCFTYLHQITKQYCSMSNVPEDEFFFVHNYNKSIVYTKTNSLIEVGYVAVQNRGTSVQNLYPDLIGQKNPIVIFDEIIPISQWDLSPASKIITTTSLTSSYNAKIGYGKFLNLKEQLF